MGNISILVVDDEESILVSLKSILSNENYKVSISTSGSKALEMLQKEHFDVILSDIMMDDINGIELLKRSKENFPEIVFLLMTGFAHLETAIEAVRLGASDYIVKPCSKKAILSSIAHCLENNTKTKIKDKKRGFFITFLNIEYKKFEYPA